jgi:hypothetical protein
VIETLSGGHWRLERTVELPGVPQTAVAGLSCAGPGSGVAIASGRHQLTTRFRTAVVYRLSHGHWRRAVQAQPGGQPWLLDIGCAPGGPCLAVGAETQPSIRPIGFSVSPTGATALPAPAQTDTGAVTLSAIACGSATRCLAIGHVTPPGGVTDGFPPDTGALALDAWDGSAFSPVATDSTGALAPFAVACRPAFCMLAGRGAIGRPGTGHAAAARWDA